MQTDYLCRYLVQNEELTFQISFLFFQKLELGITVRRKM